MYPHLSDEHEALRRQLRRFVDQEIFPIAAKIDEDQSFPMEQYRKMGSLGFLGPSASPEYGGSGADLLTTAVIKEEIARGAPGLAMSINVCSLNFVHTIELLGTEEQKRKYLPGVIAGEKIASWMLSEPDAGSDSLALTTTARPEGGHYLVKGSKTFITNGPLADYLILVARLPGTKRAEGGVQLILDRDTEGLHISQKFNKLGMRCSPTSEVYLDDVKVPEENLLGTEGKGFPEMFRTLNAERSMGASTSIGIMQACLEICTRYVQERHQFGRPIGEFQLVQEMLAEMAMNLDISRAYCYRTVDLAQKGNDISREAGIIKLFASRAASRAASDAVQIHGGYGFIKDYQVERYFRDAKLGELGGGTSEIQIRSIARDILKRGI